MRYIGLIRRKGTDFWWVLTTSDSKQGARRNLRKHFNRYGVHHEYALKTSDQPVGQCEVVAFK